MTFTYLTSSDDREAWLESRRQGVTATEIASLANGGPSTWKKLKADKAGHGTPLASNRYMEWGNLREPVIAKQMAAKYPWLEHNSHLLAQESDPRWLATPDMIGTAGLCQIKTSLLKGERWSKPPKQYIDQCQWEMWVTGLEENILVVEYYEDRESGGFCPAFPFEGYHEFLINRDEARIAELIGIGEQFINMNEPSILDIYLHDYTRGHELEASGKAEKTAARELIEKEIAETPNFTRHVSDAGSISLGKDSVKDITVFDEAAFKAEHPELWAKYVREETKTTKGRLTITPPKREAA